MYYVVEEKKVFLRQLFQ